jgi:GNAT superfamily N-acetyltransferase
MMSTLGERTITIAQTNDGDRLFDALTEAFATDPAARWMYPDEEQYRSYFPSFVRVFGGRAIEHGAAYYSEGYSGAALWLPPEIGPDEAALTLLLEESVPERDRAALFAVFEAMGSYHPNEPHWYLPLIGVEPAQQGKGFGSSLMERALRRCDRDGRPAYLESTSPRSVPLYERHGFTVLGTIQIESSPPILPMFRAPR